MLRRFTFSYMVAAIVLLTALIYWPVVHATFAWDELLDSLNTASARLGSNWQHLILGQSNGYAIYFRPLVTGLFTLELHAFNWQAGPMHAMSLALHATNIALVGLLSMRMSHGVLTTRRLWRVAALPMTLYALHPILIEPVAWIGCQFDLAMTMLTLLGLILNVSVQRVWVRALCVAVCFLFAAFSKESAISFPLILVIMDWIIVSKHSINGLKADLIAMLRRNGAVYASTALAGVIYLALRLWSLGHLIEATPGKSLGSFGRLQEVSFLLVHYWRMLFWPMTGLSPIHQVDVAQFLMPTMNSAATDLGALGIVSLGIVLSIRRKPAGGLILAVTCALLPVLHIIPIKFDSSLYHERYAMTALALACALLPAAVADIRWPARRQETIKFAASIITALWLFGSVMNIRVTVPLWASNVKIWQWALIENPTSVKAQEGLLGAYVDSRDYASAHRLVEKLMTQTSPCGICVLDAAAEASSTNQPALASALMDRLDASNMFAMDVTLRSEYLTLRKKIATDQDDSLSFRASFEPLWQQDYLEPKHRPGPAMHSSVTENSTSVASAPIDANPLLAQAPNVHRSSRHVFDQLLLGTATATDIR